MSGENLTYCIVVLLVAISLVPCVYGAEEILDGMLVHGPHEGVVNEEYTFCTDQITDPEGDMFFCLFGWGDGTNTGWLGPYPSGQIVCASHSWSQPGVYEIKYKLKDEYGSESEWSDPFYITIAENHPPAEPTVDGLTHGKVGIEYKWIFNSIDPEGDNITYYIDWGDKCGGAEWHGPYPSGIGAEIAHRYTFKNTFIINTMAMDEHGAESNITYFEVTMPRTVLAPLLLRLLELFPNSFPILRHLLKT